MGRARNIATIFGSATPGAVTVTASPNTTLNVASISVGGVAVLQSQNTSAIAVGANSFALSVNSSALGFSANATGSNSTAIGYLARANGNNAIAIGSGPQATGANTLVIGSVAIANGPYSITIAPSSPSISTSNNGSLSIGIASYSTNNSISIGNQTTSSGNGVAIGYYANVNSTYYHGVAIGPSAQVNYTYGGSAVGYNAQCVGGSVAIGSNSYVPGYAGVGVGGGAQANGYAAAFGSDARANNYSVALGYAAYAYGNNSVVIGYNITEYSDNVIALGSSTQTIRISGSITANSSAGSAGQTLTSNGTGVYWSTPSAGFSNGSNISVANLAITAAVTANGGTGTAGQVLTSSGTGVYWSTVSANGGGGGGGGGGGTQGYAGATFVAWDGVSNPNTLDINLGGNGSAVNTAFSTLNTAGSNFMSTYGFQFNFRTGAGFGDVGTNYWYNMIQINSLTNPAGNVWRLTGFGVTDPLANWSSYSTGTFYLNASMERSSFNYYDMEMTPTTVSGAGTCTIVHSGTPSSSAYVSQANTQLTNGNMTTLSIQCKFNDTTYGGPRFVIFNGVTNFVAASSTNLTFSYTGATVIGGGPPSGYFSIYTM